MRKITAILMSVIMVCLCVVNSNVIVSQAESESVVKVMPLGDSITDGYTTAGGYRNKLCDLLEENGYSSQVDFVGSMTSGTGYDKNHEGHSGWAIEPIAAADNLAEGTARKGISSNLVTWLNTYTPDVVMLQIGSNDILSLYKLDEIETRLNNLVNTILEKIPEDGKLFLATVPYMDGNVKTYIKNMTVEEADAYVKEYNEVIERVAEDKINDNYPVTLVDINSVLVKSDLKDGVHPTAAGYDKMAEYWYGFLKEYIDPDTHPTEPTEPTTPAEPAIKTMPLGDSITDGFLTNVGGGYRDKLCDLLEENGYSDKIDFVGSMSKGNGYDKDHEGHSGWAIDPVPGADNIAEPGNTRYGISTNIKEWLETYQPQVVMLQIGTNDLLSLYKLDEIETRLTNLVDTILEYIPEDGMLFLSTIPLIDTDKTSWSWLKKIDSEEMNRYVEDYNFTIQSVAEDKINEDLPVTFVDMYSVLTSDDLEAGDGVHPNKGGYNKMGEYWYGFLTDYVDSLEKKEEPTVPPTQPSTAPTQPTTQPTVAPTQSTAPTVQSVTSCTALATDTYYTGKACETSVVVKNGSTTLQKGVDYQLIYKNNVKPGKATVTVVGIGKYTGIKEVTFNITVRKNTTFTVGALKYKVLSVKNNKGAVTVTGLAKKNSTKVTVPATAKLGNYTFNVTKIAAKAFRNSKKLKNVTIGKNVTEIGTKTFENCKKLKKVDIKTTKLKKAGKNLFKGTKATIKMPAKCKKPYKKLLNK